METQCGQSLLKPSKGDTTLFATPRAPKGSAMAQTTNQADMKLESLRKARRDIEDEMDAVREEASILRTSEEEEEKARAGKKESDERDMEVYDEGSPTGSPSMESMTLSRRGRADAPGGQPT